MGHLEITNEMVERMAHRLGGSVGPAGTDSSCLRGWLLNFGPVSRALQNVVARVTEKMCNENVDWAMHRGFMVGRLIALDKSPGVRPIGIGETWRRLFAKVLLSQVGPEATEACSSNQLCAGLKAGIEGGIEAAKQLQDLHAEEEEWGFLLVDARNAFNELNRYQLLWTVRHEWPSGSHFVFNCYKFWSTLIIRDGKKGEFIFSKEGVTQGDPLAMVCYGIATLPLIRKMKELGDTVHIWYADDAGVGGRITEIEEYWSQLSLLGPKWGYFPEEDKSVLVSDNVSAPSSTLKSSKGCRYLGGFVGSEEKC